MKELNKHKGIRLYSFETEQEKAMMAYMLPMIFSGTKAELLQKNNSFWEDIVESGNKWTPALYGSTQKNKAAYRDYTVTGFQSLKGSKRLPFKTALESIISAIENEKEFIIITQEIHGK